MNILLVCSLICFGVSVIFWWVVGDRAALTAILYGGALAGGGLVQMYFQKCWVNKVRKLEELDTQKRKEYLEREVYPKFREAFPTTPVELYETDREAFRYATKVYMEDISRKLGKFAIWQEECRMAGKHGWPYHSTQEHYDQNVLALTARWEEARSLLAEVDYEHALFLPDWTDIEPYVSYYDWLHSREATPQPPPFTTS